MADIAGGYIATPDPFGGSGAFVLSAASLISTITAGGTLYLMEAKDSVTGAIYKWLLTRLDLSGAGYTGPNSPLLVEVAGIRAL